MGKISTIWSEPEYYPTLRSGGEVMGLKDVLRLKSFDSIELDIRATKTEKGDRPYLEQVNANLSQIQNPCCCWRSGWFGLSPTGANT
ncbi:hypothetical protein Hanom_Chr11g00978911 [Helianthus anomalus]